ncbi:MAG: nucleotide exchange factor GrpE [Elusimicrobia bacterium GWC2_51_8]|nr:MAG: nucleotide exchange factor GrpE [Elusimicrobia bacterium GWA2_51_34]OGR61898.1 MAG: nucleotide exchange factor GrpE [Elusimicrobia bacterium GWC2_51_8]OGR84703.1 MAG: nucleotide exchange factor GrpE [Elusimicrobia bacterium GWF2_52_66]
MKRHMVKLLLSRINSRLENIFSSLGKNNQEVGKIIEEINGPAFSAGVARGIIQRLESSGVVIPMGAFEGLVRDLLIFLDRLESLERRGPKLASLRLELEGILERAGLEPISIDGAFNSLLHRAEHVVEGPSESPCIVKQLRFGYKVKDKVVRPAGVVVQMRCKNKGGHNEQDK